MKKIILLCSLIILCSGCSSTSSLTRQHYDAVTDYINVVGERGMIYIEKDTTISEREKNVYKTRHRLIKETIKEIEIKD